MAEKEQRDAVMRQVNDEAARKAIEEVTPEQQEWFRLAGFSRIEWQRLVYARWRHREGLLGEYPQEQA
jgi:N-acetylglutamate synthase-like GNAT family acetyltransferase